jgi:hypothetical protein
VKKPHCKTCGRKLPFDKVAYQKQYMRERRAAAKAKALPVDLKGDPAALYKSLLENKEKST